MSGSEVHYKRAPPLLHGSPRIRLAFGTGAYAHLLKDIRPREGEASSGCHVPTLKAKASPVGVIDGILAAFWNE